MQMLTGFSCNGYLAASVGVSLVISHNPNEDKTFTLKPSDDFTDSWRLHVNLLSSVRKAYHRISLIKDLRLKEHGII